MTFRWIQIPYLTIISCIVFAMPDRDVIPPEQIGGKIHWVYGYEEGKKIARDTGKLIFVVFRCER